MVESEPLPPGRGAFLNCNADTASVSGPVPNPTVSLSEGWNLIGPHAQAVAPSDLSTDPEGLLETSFYGFEPDGGGYSGELDYTVSTPDTSFSATGSTTADVPIGDGDDLTITHSDSEYISTFAVNNTDTEQPPFQTSGFPAEPDYQGSSSISIDKSSLVNQYQIRAIPSTSPGGYDTQSEYSGELFDGRWTNRDGYDEVLGIVTTTRIDNEEDVPQSVIDKMNDAYAAAANQMPFPITQVERTFSEVQDIYNNRGVNFNYTGIDSGSPVNNLTTSNGYAERGYSAYGENEANFVIEQEVYESLTGIEGLESNIFNNENEFSPEAKFIPKLMYSLDS